MEVNQPFVVRELRWTLEDSDSDCILCLLKDTEQRMLLKVNGTDEEWIVKNRRRLIEILREEIPEIIERVVDLYFEKQQRGRNNED